MPLNSVQQVQSTFLGVRKRQKKTRVPGPGGTLTTEVSEPVMKTGEEQDTLYDTVEKKRKKKAAGRRTGKPGVSSMLTGSTLLG